MIETSLLALWWLLFGAAALWLMVGSVAYWVKQGWLPPDTSGWAQAIGAITAVLAAWWISERGHKKAELAKRQMDHAEKIKNAEVLYTLAVTAESTFLQVAHALDQSPWRDIDYYREEISWLLPRLSSMFEFGGDSEFMQLLHAINDEVIRGNSYLRRRSVSRVNRDSLTENRFYNACKILREKANTYLEEMKAKGID
ncbi:hypothetical protein P7C00_18900 [Pseudomonas sp. JDS08PS003]|uniref:hypothetical protein n=1 Tax=Pseudomonas sp. JDS08PS003 TaxID=2497162 RepID=UPI0038578931